MRLHRAMMNRPRDGIMRFALLAVLAMAFIALGSCAFLALRLLTSV